MKNKLISKLNIFSKLYKKINNIQLALGRIEVRQLELLNSMNSNNWEFQVYSQWGEDGIIQFLIKNIEIKNKIFVEFGVETYTEANTLFLLQNDYWKGYVIDGSKSNIEQIQNSEISWRHDLISIYSFITKDNISTIFKTNGIVGEIGILSIDIDGNDYWVWDNIIDLNPCIVIAEYNSLFGATEKVSIPYQEDFVRGGNNPVSYYGASIAALTHLANNKGYELVASNKAGNNVFFVRKDLLGNLKPLSPQNAYVRAQFKESRNANGDLTYFNFDAAKNELLKLKLINVETMQEVFIK